jgi:hypothetical protein
MAIPIPESLTRTPFVPGVGIERGIPQSDQVRDAVRRELARAPIFRFETAEPGMIEKLAGRAAIGALDKKGKRGRALVMKGGKVVGRLKIVGNLP